VDSFASLAGADVAGASFLSGWWVSSAYAPWAHNIADAVDSLPHKYISHTLVQLYPVPEKTQNCVATVLEFACVGEAKKELLAKIRKGLLKYSVSSETGMVALSDFDASGLMGYSRLCRGGMVTKELALKTAEENGVEIYIDGNGIIGALAALPCAGHPSATQARDPPWRRAGALATDLAKRDR